MLTVVMQYEHRTENPLHYQHKECFVISKDQSITTQVAFKGAVDLAAAAGGDITTLVANFAIAFETLKEIMDDAQEFGTADASRIQQAFPNSTMHTEDEYSRPFGEADMVSAAAPAGGIRIKGTQHGPLPDWLFSAASKAGIGEVYDNRDGLAENPKRPWFKATTGGKEAAAFWPPKG
jgi:hypothetical protein